MVLYYFDGNIIGRGSGRSATGAAAYRAGGILRSAAYRAGEELRDDTGEIVHDYTRKTGVIHSEIILPKNALPEFVDREILWNAVEASEKRKDSQLAREIIVAQQREFSLQEQIEVLREYIRENFVDKGMCADLNIHDKGDGNPHAHIMLTTRHVTPEGFGLKNTDWNKKDLFVSWRKSWADVNNRMFERKGLDDRIDHRSYKEQGLDKEPMIHLGVEASAKEKRGKKTRRGDINREIQKRNEERAKNPAEKTERGQELAETAENTKAETVIAKEKPSNDEHTLEKTAQHLDKLREYYTKLEKELAELILQRNEIREELPRLGYRAESMDEHAKNIETLQGKIAELQESRQNLRLLQWKKKQKADEAIKYAEYELKKAKIYFNNRFNINPDQTSEEIKRIQEKIRVKEADVHAKNARILNIMNTQDKVLLGYHTQKLLAESQHDKEEINKFLEKLNKPPEAVRDRLLQERIDRRLNIIPDESFHKVIEKLPPEQVKILTDIRGQHKERERLKELEHTEKDHSHTFERSR